MTNENVTRGRQYELPPEPAKPATGGPKPFNLMLRKPGSENLWLSPGYDDPDEWLRRDFYDEGDGRDDKATDWSLSLPHQCGEWGIWDGAREEVLDAALRLRNELDQAIAALESAGTPVPHRIALSVRVKPPERGGSYSITHPPACDRLVYGEQCAFQLAWWRTKPELPELGVYDAVVREGGIEFLRVRDLEAGDWHG